MEYVLSSSGVPLNLDFERTSDAIRAIDALTRLEFRLQYLGAGRERAVFRISGHVIKVPLGDPGVSSNMREVHYFREEPLYYGRCRPLKIEGCPCLMMEYLAPLEPGDLAGLARDWVGRVDHFQIGINARGAVRAYDFGN